MGGFGSTKFGAIGNNIGQNPLDLGNQAANLLKNPVGNNKIEDAKPTCFFILGGPGCGKGTMCTNLVKDFGLIHLSAGDLLREERDSGSVLATLINNLILEGKIVPAEITCKLLKVAMEKFGWANKKFLIDGFPRSLENQEGWEKGIG